MMQASFAALLAYTLKSVPLATGASCHDEASAIGERFRQATGVTVERAACEALREGSFDMRVTYEADEPVPLVTTYVWPSTLKSAGAFATRALCEAALPAETERFEAHTGLTAVVSYCYQEELTRRDPWAFRIDGFGAARVRPFYSGGLLFGSPVGFTRVGFESALARGLAERGVDPRFVKARDAGGYAEVSAMYYGEAQIDLQIETQAKVLTEQHCHAELQDLTRMLTEIGHAPLLAHCAKQFTGWYEVQSVGRDPAVRKTLAVERFASYEACRAGLAALVAQYRDRLGRTVVGGLCTLDDAADAGRLWGVTLVEASFARGVADVR